MLLEAVWFKNGKEIYWVDPVMNIVCDEDMSDISDIEVFNGFNWYSSKDIEADADGFVIRIKEGSHNGKKKE